MCLILHTYVFNPAHMVFDPADMICVTIFFEWKTLTEIQKHVFDPAHMFVWTQFYVWSSFSSWCAYGWSPLEPSKVTLGYPQKWTLGPLGLHQVEGWFGHHYSSTDKSSNTVWRWFQETDNKLAGLDVKMGEKYIRTHIVAADSWPVFSTIYDTLE